MSVMLVRPGKTPGTSVCTRSVSIDLSLGGTRLRVIDEATQTTHAAELEAVHVAISPRSGSDITTTLDGVMENWDHLFR